MATIRESVIGVGLGGLIAVIILIVCIVLLVLGKPLTSFEILIMIGFLALARLL